MPHVEESIDIGAPVEAVYDLIANQPERMAEWWPPIELQERVTPPPTTLGSISQYVYHMMNVTIRGEHEVVALEPNRYLRVETISGIDSAFDFQFAPNGSGTHLTIRVDYTLPGSIVGQIMNRVIIEERNLKDLREGLRNLKTIAETEAAQPKIN
jgi:uncharacterized membrane protein